MRYRILRALPESNRNSHTAVRRDDLTTCPKNCVHISPYARKFSITLHILNVPNSRLHG